MNELEARYDVTRKDLAKGRRMKIGVWTAPALLTVLPASSFGILFVLFGSNPAQAVVFLSLGVIATIAGLIIGLIISGVLMYRHSNWTKQMRERIAADGIRAEEIDWFK